MISPRTRKYNSYDEYARGLVNLFDLYIPIVGSDGDEFDGVSESLSEYKQSGDYEHELAIGR